MDILVIGGGGREHAIIKSLKKSAKVGTVYCLPGNGGMAEAKILPILPSEKEKIVAFLDSHNSIKLTVVAPDNPLVDGLVNYLEQRGHRAFGPTAEAAIIEGSKRFAKKFMVDNHIPTAAYAEFDDFSAALNYTKSAPYPLVIKADGLAYGKGVIICQTPSEAEGALSNIMLDAAFGKDNTSVIVEEFLTGREVSVLAFTDGKTIVPMLSAQDHKRIFDGDRGANTGGMGAFSPSPYYTVDIMQKTNQQIITPTINGLNAMGRTFKGVIYFGLMLVEDEPYLLEYNARFGDPETQSVLPLLKTDLLEIFEAIVDERLADLNIEWEEQCAVTVVFSSKGYPNAFEKGKKITIGNTEGVELFFAGVTQNQGELYTSGGRVLAATALGNTIAEAREKVYAAIANIHFEGMFFRKDIGIK
ncbi:MAG: phosphoribosylamine--glycine ligase [Clostridia bacterium]